MELRNSTYESPERLLTNIKTGWGLQKFGDKSKQSGSPMGKNTVALLARCLRLPEEYVRWPVRWAPGLVAVNNT